MNNDRMTAENSAVDRYENTKKEPVERMIAPLPILDWDTFLAMPDKEKREFVRAVRKEFGKVGYNAFHTIFDGHRYWLFQEGRKRWRQCEGLDEEAIKQAGLYLLYKEVRTYPPVSRVTKELKRLGYRWKTKPLCPERRKRFVAWCRQGYRVRAGEYIAPHKSQDTAK